MYKQIAANKRKTVFIIMGFILLIGLVGAAIAWAANEWSIALWAFIVAAIYALIQYFCSASLATVMTGAREITKKDNPRLYNTVENLSITTGLPMPKVYIIDDPAPNAFAAGRDPAHSVVAATTGLLDIMDKNELEAVMAHEMAHIKNYDIRVSAIVFGLVCVIGVITDLGFRMLYFGDRDSEDRSPVAFIALLATTILAPIVASLAQMAVSREREYLADASSVNITRNPDGMISALKKLGIHTRPMRQQNSATEALFIANPLKKGFFSNLFSTHPSIEKRIERLEHGKHSF